MARDITSRHVIDSFHVRDSVKPGPWTGLWTGPWTVQWTESLIECMRMECCSFFNDCWVERVHIECCPFYGILITPQKEQPGHHHHNLSFLCCGTLGGTNLGLVVPAVLSSFSATINKNGKKRSGHARLC